MILLRLLHSTKQIKFKLSDTGEVILEDGTKKPFYEVINHYPNAIRIDVIEKKEDKVWKTHLRLK